MPIRQPIAARRMLVSPWPRALRRMGRWTWLPLLLLVAACNGQTLFQSNFDPTAPGEPPAVAQTVGTAHVFGPPGSVVVVAAPVQPPSDKWVRIARADNKAQIAGMQGALAQFAGAGSYTFSTYMFMPSGAGLATIQFEPFGQAPDNLMSFLHIDFLQNNTVRIDDIDATAFGSFPRDQIFIVLVSLNINASAPTAHIVISGAGASGTKDYTIQPAFISMAQQFGAVRLWMGFPWTGSFQASNIGVSYVMP
jgi:hypothetical protein